MATQRKLVFVNNYIYHVYNRGIDERDIYLCKKDYLRFIELLKFYNSNSTKISYSKFIKLSQKDKDKFVQQHDQSGNLIEILAYCLMPNHFHLLLRQSLDGGITKYLSNVANAYAQYFNLKYKRKGTLYQGAFKAVFIESDAQLTHMSRYIHINPVVSSLVELSKLECYPWSSLKYYLNSTGSDFVNSKLVLSYFGSIEKYKNFIYDQIDYGKELEKIKHAINDY